MSLVPKLVQVTVPEGVSPGDTINVEAEGQTVQCQVPEGLKPGDTFQVQTATQPVVPPHAVREGQVVHGSITDEEKHCLDLRFSTRIIAVVDIVLSVLNVIFGSAFPESGRCLHNATGAAMASRWTRCVLFAQVSGP